MLSYKAYKNSGTPSGDFDITYINILGMDVQILAAGPLFKFRSSIFVIICKDQKKLIITGRH